MVMRTITITRPSELMSKVKPSAQFIALNAKNVSIDESKCLEVASEIYKKMKARNYSSATWSTHPLNPKATDQGVIDWIFTVDCLNFSFWSESPDKVFAVEYKEQTWAGYWSMVAAINRALDEKIPITSPSFWVSEDFTLGVLKNVFRSSTEIEIPLLSERYNILREAGEALARAGFSSFEEVIGICNESALFLVDWLSTNIASFNDVTTFAGQKVCIFKRAQILVADLWACYQGSGPCKFKDIDDITMFADYRVPQILVVLGCISYSRDLAEKIAAHKLLEPGSPDEVEIRGCSVHAVELIVQQINKITCPANEVPAEGVNAIIVDFYLWDTAKQEERTNSQVTETHRTRTIFY